MITKEDFTTNLKILRILYKIKMFPMWITVPDGSSHDCASPEAPGKNRVVLRLVLVLACIHSMYLQARLVQYVVQKGLVMSYELALHLNIAIASIFVCWWYWIYLCRDPRTATEMMNMLYRNIAKLGRREFDRWEIYTRQDWVAVLVSPIGLSAWVGLLGLYCVDPSMKFLAISLPQNSSPWLKVVFWPICALEEAYVLLFYIQFGVFSIYTRVLFFEVALRSLSGVADRHTDRSSSYSGKKFLLDYRKIRELQLWTVVFNEVNSTGLYLFKLYCLIVGTVMGFSAVRNEMGGIFSIVFFLNFADIVILYSVLYERAFAVPETCNRAKRAMAHQIAGSMLLDKQWKKYAIRRVKSLPSYGIKIGSFHMFERDSTPVFVDYVVRNIAGLLVM